ncbi:MAG: UDP-glucose 4-epimerase GalE [Clostridia bacterium]|nr:UDP-glucose 4-epimerase GalE [Clostridia bacterium]
MILVTGGAGFIGSHTCVELLNKDHEIVIADNLVNSKIASVEAIKQITGKSCLFYELDINDEDGLRALFRSHDITSVIHFAGLKSVGESCKFPHRYYSNNVGGTLTLLKIMREFSCKSMVFSSSATVYGRDNDPPFTESMPTSATNPYGWTKVIQEQILVDQAKADPEMRIALLRYFNPVGAHPSGLIGEDPVGIPNNLVPYICKVALGRLPYLNVYGNDYDTVDGTGVRDYIHVVDLAKGHIEAMKYLDNNRGVLTVNLGTGIGYSVLELVDAYSRASGKEIPVRFMPRRSGDIATSYANAEKACELLGWKAELGIEDMCRDSWNYAQKKM